ncbi:MAG: PEP-CTERM sorting domain-containing protein [Nitrospirales bacterium]
MLKTISVAKGHCLQLILIISFTIGLLTTSSAFAAPYNYFADGEDFDITGRFQCASLNVKDCAASDLTDWMFEVVTPTGTLLEFNELDSLLRIVNFGATAQFEVQLTVARLNQGESLEAKGQDAQYTLLSGPPIRTSLLSAPVITAKPVPVPTTILLFLTGLAGLVGYRWSQRRREDAYVV